jgi:3-oxoacyl-[acyl-carrier protein] reductase
MSEAETLAGRAAIVAGAGRGIGRAIAFVFAREGARLVLASRTRSELEATAAACRELGAVVDVVPTDVSSWSQTEELVAATVERAGAPDVLVNAAGVIGAIGPVASADPAAWAAGIEVNLLGAFHLCRAVLPRMLERRRGKIVLFAGGGAASPFPRFSSYAAAKAGVARLAETVAAEVAEYNVQVNAVAPGLVDTSLQDAVLAARELAGAQFERIRAARETGAGAVPPELAANLTLFLASEASGSLTGKLISAPHDGWRDWSGRVEELNGTPMYTLRRLDPFTLETLR